MNLKEEAKAYEPKQIQNIADLEKVPVDIEVVENTFDDSEGKQFSAKIVTVDSIDYRVPVSVLKSLKAILKEKPNTKYIKVIRTGQGMNTTYTTVPLE